jgi:hypothetical protein
MAFCPIGTGKLKALHAAYLGTTLSANNAEVCKSAISKASGAAADVLLNDGDKLTFGTRSLKVLSTPGHTEVRAANAASQYVRNLNGKLPNANKLIFCGVLCKPNT